MLRGNLNFVVQLNHASHALAAVDAKLPFVEGINPPANGDNALLRFDFKRSQRRKMLSFEEIDNPPFQFAVLMIPSTVDSYHFAPRVVKKLLPVRRQHPSPCTEGCLELLQLVCRQMGTMPVDRFLGPVRPGGGK
jgi:hypothetical protein